MSSSSRTSTPPPWYKAVLCLPALVYLMVAVGLHLRGADQPTGDEGNYLLSAESMIDDGDVDLKNNLLKLRFHWANVGESHCIFGPHGWFSIHNLGVPALIAIPWALVGLWGARLTMALICGLVAPLLYRTMNRIWPCPRSALFISTALALAMPLLHGCNQIYPDLPAAIFVLFAAQRSLAARTEATASYCDDVLLPTALPFLPWLHVKYAALALLLFAWYADATRRPRLLASGAALAGSLGMLAFYYWYAFGKLMGPYDEGALMVHPSSFIVFMGLHFDQAQGMFLQQPLWLLGLFGLAPM
jgi:hypothetical protein